MKWIIATSALLILSQPAFSQQQRACQQGDIGQTGITGCRQPDKLGATIDQSGNFNAGTTPGAATPGSGGPTILPTDPLANNLNPNPLVNSPGATGLGTAGPQAQIPSPVPAPTTTTAPTGTGGTATGVGTTGTARAPTAPGAATGSGRRAVGSGSTVTTGTSSMPSTSTPSTSMGSGGSTLGTRGGNHAIRPMGGSHALHSHSHR